MPYLRLTCPKLSPERYRTIAEHLTEAVNDLFFHPRTRLTRDELRELEAVSFPT